MGRYIPDPFETLPSELRLRIFSFLQCKSSILPLIEASPAMLQQYLANKRRILRPALAAEFDEEMIQDAMAIILCPKAHLYLLIGRDAEPMAQHIRSWSQYQLPNPLEENNDYLLDRLNNLHNQLLVLIEDYITKGIASCPPREYSCLPKTRTTERHLMFKNQVVTTRFDSAYLTATERKKFLQAFLVYELCCKTSNVRLRFLTLFVSEMVTECKLSRVQYEYLRCVDGYFRSLYGAIFAQCAEESFLRRAYEGCPLRFRVQAALAFDPNAYAPSLMWHKSQGTSQGDYAACFPRLGLDRLLDFLSYDMSNKDDRKALKRKLKFVWDSQHPAKAKDWTKAFGVLMSANGRKSSRDIYGKIGVCHQDEPQLRVAQQSAWIFFDDERFYPPEPMSQWMERPKHPRRQPGKKRDFSEYVTHWE
ncbi:uncharacterized protein B0J16DRAFT_402098 [Fusarium flagelliforme]|uniref:uncharacterized protein n=1 Tax=Fusarium flagelliforme TaxID=2675880 RepID=UPI001E8DF49D|nr:uncharacterized protein B0J16DRAFT_402098 [Fusarium flagelliforme]KAH7183595.1 hypothetical protein B0J16DRAFT_402098 [Fusarium flagelliforme]